MKMANENRLTDADKIAYQAIAQFIKENGYPPTVRELCRLTGKSSTSSIQYRLRSLERKGYIKTTDWGKRTIRITQGIEGQPSFAKDINVPSKWIPVSERLPEKNVRVLCYRPGQYYEMVVAKLVGDGWERWGKDHDTGENLITHWMPLPEPPKEDA